MSLISGGKPTSSYKGIVVAFGGPPHSGKTVLVDEVYRQALKRVPDRVFLQQGCPDGEGRWFFELEDRDQADKLRKKGEFTKEFTKFVLQAIGNLGKYFPLVLLDLGGKITLENREIIRRSTHLIILANTEDLAEAWKDLATEEECVMLGVLRSYLVEQDKIEKGNPDTSSWIAISGDHLQGNLINLIREGSPTTYESAAAQLAEHLIALSSRQ